jgi:tRNA modification GTPase
MGQNRDERGGRGRAIRLTPAGAGAIAVVRIIGAGCGEFLKTHFAATPAAGKCVHGEIVDGGRVLDDVVVVLGTDAAFADVNLHGGVWVVRAFLDLLRREGFEIIEHAGGPAPAEAMDATSALEGEVLTYLPLARTELALRTLLAQTRAWGEFNARISTLTLRLSDLKFEISDLRTEISSILSDHSLLHLLHPPRVAIIGVPNVGKSTLANQLFAQERSITADLPGTTRDWVGEIANIDGLAVMLLDTPGLREAADAIERVAIERSAEQVRAADLVVLVLDPTQALGPQRALAEQFPEAIRVVNKTDLPGKWDAAVVGGLSIVATLGTGVDELRRRVRGHFGCEAVELNRPRWWTQRQREVLLRAMGDPAAMGEMM